MDRYSVAGNANYHSQLPRKGSLHSPITIYIYFELSYRAKSLLQAEAIQNNNMQMQLKATKYLLLEDLRMPPSMYYSFQCS